MSFERDLRPVVKACAFDCAIIHAKPGNPDDVQRNSTCGAQSRYVTGVRRNLRFDKCNSNHAAISKEVSRSNHKKKRRASLEGLVVSFVRPRGPQKFVCAGGKLAV